MKVFNATDSRGLLKGSPATSSQTQIWLSEKTHSSKNQQSKVTFTVDVSGKFGIKRLKKAIECVLQSQSAYNVYFYLKDNQLMFSERTYKKRTSIQTDANDVPFAVLENINKTRFNLDDGPLYKVTIYRLSKTNVRVLFQFHHIIFDQFSVHLFWNQVVDYYNGVQQELPASSNFLAFVEKPNFGMTRNDLVRIRKEWAEKYTRIDDIKIIWIPEKDWEISQQRVQFKLIKKTQSLTSINILMGEIISNVLSKRYCSSFNDKLNIAIPYVNRFKEELYIQGHFVNMLPMMIGRSDFTHSLEDRVSMMTDNFMELFWRQRLPFDEILSTLNFSSRNEKSGFVQIAYVYARKIKLAPLNMSTKVKFKEIIQTPIDFPLVIYVLEGKSKIEIIIDFDGSLIGKNEIRYLADQIVKEYKKL